MTSTPAELADSMREVRVHVSAARTVQMMSRVQPWGSLPELSWRRPWTERNVSAAELFVDRANASAEYLYFFSPVSQLPAPLRAALSELRVLTTLFQPMVEANAWAGVPGVSSPLHYDAAVYSFHALARVQPGAGCLCNPLLSLVAEARRALYYLVPHASRPLPACPARSDFSPLLRARLCPLALLPPCRRALVDREIVDYCTLSARLARVDLSTLRHVRRDSSALRYRHTYLICTCALCH